MHIELFDYLQGMCAVSPPVSYDIDVDCTPTVAFGLFDIELEAGENIAMKSEIISENIFIFFND